jgi:hypothetical protein
VTDTVRNAVAGLGIVEQGNVVRLDVSIEHAIVAQAGCGAVTCF